MQPDADTTLADLATTLPGGSRVLQRHGLDFCCGGERTLAHACREADLDAGAVLAELEREAPSEPPLEALDEADPAELTRFLRATYHASHRQELPRLTALAHKVERVHADRGDRPVGLAAHLARLTASLLAHMEKEEQILFPMIEAGRFEAAAGPIHVMELEHEEAARDLRETRRLTNDLVPPTDACPTWRALYLALETFERELMEHAGIENHVLFARVLARR